MILQSENFLTPDPVTITSQQHISMIKTQEYKLKYILERYNFQTQIVLLFLNYYAKSMELSKKSVILKMKLETNETINKALWKLNRLEHQLGGETIPIPHSQKRRKSTESSTFNAQFSSLCKRPLNLICIILSIANKIADQ